MLRCLRAVHDDEGLVIDPSGAEETLRPCRCWSHRCLLHDELFVVEISDLGERDTLQYLGAVFEVGVQDAVFPAEQRAPPGVAQ